jgi:DNA (cytosine-5)-methyltransferase 1
MPVLFVDVLPNGVFPVRWRLDVRVLDLFSGIGGFSLGLERAGMETVAFCEIEAYPRKVLAKHWPDVPIYDDVRTLTKERLDKDGIGSIDVICGGFPCQDISVAGNQAGIEEGTRSGLWSECARLLGEIRPQYAIFENVTALLNGAGGDWFKRVLWDISQVGYDAEWHCIPASELGANHHRDRIWIIAYPNNNGSLATKERKIPDEGGDDYEKGQEQTSESAGLCTARIDEDVADTKREGLQGRERLRISLDESIKGGESAHGTATECGNDGGRGFNIWKTESELGRVADGIPDRAHRLKSLGNAVVPQIPEIIGRAILQQLTR